MTSIHCPVCSTLLPLRPVGESCFDADCRRCGRRLAVVELDGGFSVSMFEEGAKRPGEHNDEWLPEIFTVMKDVGAGFNREAIPSVMTRQRRRRAKAS